MGTITILNNTNTTINSCISAGVNYSWVNKLSPKQFYVHNGAAGVYTLSNKYWLGEGTEFGNSAAEIGLWTAGLVVGVAGLIAVPFTGGASGTLTAGAIAALSALAAGVGLTISGISIAVKDFRNEPSTWTNIHAIKNRKFVAEATVETKLENGVLTYTKVPAIQFREIDEEEFQRMIVDQGFVGYQKGEGDAAQLPTTYVKHDDADLAKLLSKPLRMFPSLGGDACWEVEGDQRSDGAPMQLWSRDAPLARWRIVPVTHAKFQDVFALHNVALDTYATYLGGNSNRITSCKERDARDRQLFHIGKSNRQWVFFPAHAATMSVIPEDGNQGNSTKLVVAPNRGPNPAFARWRVVVG